MSACPFVCVCVCVFPTNESLLLGNSKLIKYGIKYVCITKSLKEMSSEMLFRADIP